MIRISPLNLNQATPSIGIKHIFVWIYSIEWTNRHEYEQRIAELKRHAIDWMIKTSINCANICHCNIILIPHILCFIVHLFMFIQKEVKKENKRTRQRVIGAHQSLLLVTYDSNCSAFRHYWRSSVSLWFFVIWCDAWYSAEQLILDWMRVFIYCM